MWLFLPFGFFSIVQKPNRSDALCIRARWPGDLETLRERYLPELSDTEAFTGTDYQYRAWAPHDAVKRALGEIAGSIDYNNFKNKVDSDRQSPYMQVWSILNRAARTLQRNWK
tara:strand:+ start:355 stop:693 length:339 start_codon:yes stop_codon:yes gene_type:complete